MHHFGGFESADENTRLNVRRLDQVARIETRRKEEKNVDEETTKKARLLEIRRSVQDHEIKN